MDVQMQQMAERMRALKEGKKGAAYLPPALPPAPPPAPPPATDDDLLTLEEAAKLAKVSVPTFKKWGVPVFRRGRVVRVQRRALRNFIAGSTAATDDAGGQREG